MEAATDRTTTTDNSKEEAFPITTVLPKEAKATIEEAMATAASMAVIILIKEDSAVRATLIKVDITTLIKVAMAAIQIKDLVTRKERSKDSFAECSSLASHANLEKLVKIDTRSRVPMKI